MSGIRLSNLKKSYGNVEIIKGIDLDISSGEFCVFVGPSGCGKSTLLRMISGLEDISSGDIFVGGKVVNKVPAAERGLAMVFQSYALYPHMTVKQNLSFGLENINTPQLEIERKISEVSQMLQIENLLNRRPKDLSGGQRQRVAIGRAVVREPNVFLFDEPLSNLDAELRVGMRGEISALHRRLGNTMIYVTHDQVEAMTMADKIVVLRLGELEQYGDPLTLYNYPDNMFVAGFLGSPRMNFIQGQIKADDRTVLQCETGEEILLPDKGFSQKGGQKVTLGIRPDDLKVADIGEGAITMSITGIEQHGGQSYIYGDMQDQKRLTLHRPGQTQLALAMKVGMNIPIDKIHLFDTNSELSLREK